MEQIKYENAIRYVLCYAIEHDGIASYNPCMYDLGCADNIPPSEDFNRELKKFGRLQYRRNLEEDEYYSNYGYDIWNCFYIDERGRRYIEEVNKYDESSKNVLTSDAKKNKGERVANLIFAPLGCVGCLIPLLLPISVGCLITAFLCNINPEETYFWYSGIWHGIFFIPNLIMHFLNSDILFKANHYTLAYNVWWWISSISCLGSIFGILGGGRR